MLTAKNVFGAQFLGVPYQNVKLQNMMQLFKMYKMLRVDKLTSTKNLLFSFTFSASVDSKWYRWIEDHFNVDESNDRKITFEQFKNALHLKKVCS